MKMQINSYKIKSDKASGLRFAFVSDLHGCKNAPVINALSRLMPDAVLVGGDFLHSNEEYESGFEFLELCAKRFPTFVSIGNHERRFLGDLVFRINQTGAVLLDNCFTDFCGVKIGGFSSPYEKKHTKSENREIYLPNYGWLSDFANEKGFKLLLCHRPEYFERYILPLDIDLTLSGHAHGGQWRFFKRGVYSPGQGVFPKYTFGSYFDNRLIVGKGLGNGKWVPRINNKKEIVLIEFE